MAKFHLDITIDKSARDDFGELDRAGVVAKLDELLDYCAADVVITHRVYQIVFPNFLETCPHPVSFAALRHLSAVILPVDRSWETYIANAEATYHELSDAVQERLVNLTQKALEIKDDAEKWQNDPWLQQLDWSGQEIKMVKGKKKGDPPRPAARQKKPGMPRWYKDLFAKNDSPIGLTVRTRLAPLLLRLAWDGHPLFWSDKYGWTFRVAREEAAAYADKQMVRCDLADETVEALRLDRDHVYFKLPHKDGPTARCANPMAKGYLAYFEKGTLSSEYSYAKEALEMNASCSYWISARDRIMSQLVVYESDLPGRAPAEKDQKTTGRPDQGFILPQVIPMGTITRRAVENTWLTASNAKNNRVGSELKAMVKAPPGYCFVGADVDSEELWIASLVGDATFKLHGGNAIGFMTLEGTKAAGTDLHSRTASILGITRNDAKVFNYGRIYGAGLRFATQLLRQFNPGLAEAETASIASRLYVATKGTKTNRKLLHRRPFWRGGTESFVFNRLEEFAEQERPRTPVLGAGITEALMRRFVSKGGYLTSRINWAIQSSGQDYLHLLIVAMDYLVRRFGIDARLAITVHDEIRYLVREPDRYRAAMALQGRQPVDARHVLGAGRHPRPAPGLRLLLRRRHRPRAAQGGRHGLRHPPATRRPSRPARASTSPRSWPAATRPPSPSNSKPPPPARPASTASSTPRASPSWRPCASPTPAPATTPSSAPRLPPTRRSCGTSWPRSARATGHQQPQHISLKGVLPYYSQARLVPTDEPISVTEALGAKFARGGGGLDAAGRWTWGERYGPAKGAAATAPRGASSRL